MIMQGMIVNSKLDKQNSRLSKESLYRYVEDFNRSETVQSVSINHDPTIMPIGKVLSAETKLDLDGEVEVITTQEIAEQFKEVIYGEEIFFSPVLTTDDKRPITRMTAPETGIVLSVDFANYTKDNYLQLKHELEEVYNCKLEGLGRKSVFNDPIFVISLSAISPLIAMVGKKTCDKLSDKISDDLVSLYDKIKNLLVVATKNVIKGYKSQTFKVIESVNGYTVELLIITENADKLLETIEAPKLVEINEKIDSLNKLFDIDCIQFLFDNDTQKWEFNYLLSKTGDIIGSEKCYKNTKDIYDKNVLGRSNMKVSVEFSSGKLGEADET